MPISTAPGRAATAGSTSRGMARSRNTSGPRAPRLAVRRASAAAASSRVMTWPTAPVHETTISAAARAPARSASATARPPTRSARRSACRQVRFTTAMLAAPPRLAVVAASAAIEPAPTISTSRPASSSWPSSSWPGAGAGPGAPGRAAAPSSIARLTRLCPARSMPVSARARLPARRASRPSSPSTRPTVPCSSPSLTAERTWPRIWPSPATTESSPQATASRWDTARSS